MEIEENSEIITVDNDEAVPSNNKRITTRYMTKYEKARILGARSLQLRYF